MQIHTLQLAQQLQSYGKHYMPGTNKAKEQEILKEQKKQVSSGITSSFCTWPVFFLNKKAFVKTKATFFQL